MLALLLYKWSSTQDVNACPVINTVISVIYIFSFSKTKSFAALQLHPRSWKKWSKFCLKVEIAVRSTKRKFTYALGYTAERLQDHITLVK